MALKKQLQFNNIEANYWRIVGFNVSVTGKMCQVYLVGYFDAVTRIEKKNLISKNYIMKSDVFDKYITLGTADNYVSKLYDYLKLEIEDFKGATDC